MEKIAEKVDDHLQPIPQDIMGSVTRTDPETLKQYEEMGMYNSPAFTWVELAVLNDRVWLVQEDFPLQRASLKRRL